MEISNYMTIQSLQKFLDRLPSDKIVVAFYINVTDVSQNEWMDSLAEVLHQHGFISIGILTPQAQSTVVFEKTEITAVVSMSDIVTLTRINIFIISDMDYSTDYPEKSRVLACKHALEPAVDTSLGFSLDYLPGCDGWMCPFPLSPKTRSVTKDLWTGFHHPQYCRRKNQNYYIIPLGYPRLAVLSEKLANMEVSPDAIVYAPKRSKISTITGGDRIKNDGQRVIQALLDAFPSMKIIFRPYKTELGSPLIKSLCKKFASEPRFELDSNSGREFSFARGAVLVTDLSHIAPSFSYTTLRPSVYFQPWKFQKVHFSEEMPHFTAYTLDGLVQCVQLALEKAASYKAEIEKLRNQRILPFEDAFQELAGWLMDFYNEKPRSDWLVIPRNDSTSIQNDIEIVEKLSKNIDCHHGYTYIAALAYNSPGSHLLAACAMSMLKISRPELLLPEEFKKNIQFLLDKRIDARVFGEISFNDIVRLCKIYIGKHIAVGDFVRVRLATDILCNLCLELFRKTLFWRVCRKIFGPIKRMLVCQIRKAKSSG